MSILRIESPETDGMLQVNSRLVKKLREIMPEDLAAITVDDRGDSVLLAGISPVKLKVGILAAMEMAKQTIIDRDEIVKEMAEIALVHRQDVDRLESAELQMARMRETCEALEAQNKQLQSSLASMAERAMASESSATLDHTLYVTQVQYEEKIAELKAKHADQSRRAVAVIRAAIKGGTKLLDLPVE